MFYFSVPAFWKHPPQHDHVQVSLVAGIFRWKAEMVVACERCKSPRKQHLPSFAWAWQASRLPGPAPWGGLHQSPTLSPRQGKSKYLWSSGRTNLWKRMSWYWWGEEKEVTEKFWGPLRLSCCEAPAHSPCMTARWWADSGRHNVCSSKLGRFQPFHLWFPRNPHLEHAGTFLSICPPFLVLYWLHLVAQFKCMCDLCFYFPTLFIAQGIRQLENSPITKNPLSLFSFLQWGDCELRDW